MADSWTTVQGIMICFFSSLNMFSKDTVCLLACLFVYGCGQAVKDFFLIREEIKTKVHSLEKLTREKKKRTLTREK